MALRMIEIITTAEYLEQLAELLKEEEAHGV